MDEYYRVVRALGPPFGDLLGTLPPARAAEIQEIRLRAGQPLQFTVAGRLVPCARLLPVLRASGPLRQEDIRQTFLALCGHSVYAYEQELQDGYFTLPGGHRVGVAGLRGPGGFAAVTALCLRVARFITCPLPQALRQALDRLDGGILVIGPPGSGKTTLLRSILYYLAAQARIVCVADERGELLGEEGAPPDKPCVNCDVFTRCPRAAAVLMALRCLNPQVILCDEIGTRADADALEQGVASGVVFVASVHGEATAQLSQKPHLRRLLATGAFTQAALLAGRAQPGQVRAIEALP